MEEEDDREEWLAGAAASVAVVAHEIICLSHPWKRVSWRKLIRSEGGGGASDLEILQEGMGVLEQELALPPPGWGVRRRRRTRVPDESTICELEEDVAAKDRARASPATPLDFSAGSGASVSCEEGSSGAVCATAAAMTKREATAKVGPGGGPPAVFRIPAANPIRRPGKKKTILELQVLEKSYVEERCLLHKELEARRRARDVLAEENDKLKKLKMLLSSELASPIVGGTLQNKQPMGVHETQGRDVFAPLPDLNEPWPEDIN